MRKIMKLWKKDVNKIAITDADGKGNWLVPFRKKKNLNFSLVSLLPDEKDYVLIEADVNNNRTPDVVRMNINSGRTTTILRGNSKIQGDFVADKDGEIRAASGWNTSDDTIDLFARKKGDDEWINITWRDSKDGRYFTSQIFSSKKKLTLNAFHILLKFVCYSIQLFIFLPMIFLIVSKHS